MNFADKYELFEALSSGAVETFVARDTTTGERVLLHIFECRERGSNIPSLQWVLQEFRRFAPGPPGLVIEAGRYDRAAYGYLVTQLPDTALVQNWLRAYEAAAQENKEPPARVAPSPISRSRNGSDFDREQPARSQANSGRDNAPDEFTKAFRDLSAEPGSSFDGSESRDSTHPETASVPDSYARLRGSAVPSAEMAGPRKPGPFTEQFLAKLDQPFGQIEADHTPPPPSKSAGSSISVDRFQSPGERAGRAAGTSHEGQSFTALFRSSDVQQNTLPRVPDNTSGGDASKTGEFTNFFRGPFTGDSPAEVPDISPQAPPGKGPGEFTILFGSPRNSATLAPPLPDGPLSDVSLGEEAGAARKWAPASEPPERTSTTTPLPWQPQEASETTRTFPTVREPAWTPTDTSATKMPAGSSGPFPSTPAEISGFRDQTLFSPRSEDGSATRVLSTGREKPELGAPPLPSGPSEYTRIISPGMKDSPTMEPPLGRGAARPDASGPLPGFSPPPPIVLPPIPIPPAPQFPPSAKVPAPPPAPKVEPPKWPPAPQPAPETPKPPVSYLPLILVLNGLFILAVLLVLYFALKH